MANPLTLPADVLGAIAFFELAATGTVPAADLWSWNERLGRLRGMNSALLGRLWFDFLQRPHTWKDRHASFRDAVEKECPVSHTTILTLVANYRHFVVNGDLSLEDLVRLTAQVGWKKVGLMREGNVPAEQVETVTRRIVERKLNVNEVRAELQMLDTRQPPLSETAVAVGPQVFCFRTFAWSEREAAIVDKTVELVQAKFPHLSMSKAVYNACADYLANHMGRIQAEKLFGPLEEEDPLYAVESDPDVQDSQQDSGTAAPEETEG